MRRQGSDASLQNQIDSARKREVSNSSNNLAVHKNSLDIIENKGNLPQKSKQEHLEASTFSERLKRSLSAISSLSIRSSNPNLVAPVENETPKHKLQTSPTQNKKVDEDIKFSMVVTDTTLVTSNLKSAKSHTILYNSTYTSNGDGALTRAKSHMDNSSPVDVSLEELDDVVTELTISPSSHHINESQSNSLLGISSLNRSTAKSLPKISQVGPLTVQQRKNKNSSSVTHIGAQNLTTQIQNFNLLDPSLINPTNKHSSVMNLSSIQSSKLTVTTMNAPLSGKSRPGTLSAYEICQPTLSRDFTLDDFSLIKRVGKGGFATVFLIRLRTSGGRYFALKAIKKADVVKVKQEKQ
ncbi:hypothetical protein HK096_008298, partial [Nowakowskiella sp. JEL0078]